MLIPVNATEMALISSSFLKPTHHEEDFRTQKMFLQPHIFLY